ncbi:carbamate kinase [Trinickia dabaoshanensis]|uniref:Carbamate kinase n=1 Tax=Trinickia dabaoshanensis TaxID=564714 RepID=A0A2N7VBY9_9BURK|nr:carbamate kinase [Trinickia dabaoshanensis]PMS14676.1 carbamate kinase [Trinickia dabaoshanensis]
MRIVIALGGNALLKRGQKISAEAQTENVRLAAAQLAQVAEGNELVIVHGNGPQVGLLASQEREARASAGFPLDVLDAETEGMIGYPLELELRNRLPKTRACATLLTMVEVDANDPAFEHPEKPIGAMLTDAAALESAKAKGWSIARDGTGYRRVVPSPRPKRLVQVAPLRWLLAQHAIVICAGGGGIPVVAAEDGTLHGIEAVVDKDRSAALVAEAIEADLFVIATDVAGVFADWGTPGARLLTHLTPRVLRERAFAAGSMGPKVEAAASFVERTGRRASIGALTDVAALVEGTAGTTMSAYENDAPVR